MEIDSLIDQAVDRLARAERVLVTCHRGPDGDSVGSMIALAAILRAQGKRATLFSPDLVPRNLKWLPLVKSWVHKLRKDADYDLTVIMDCGDRKLLGKSFPRPEVTGDLLVLDHHASVRPFGELFVCDAEAASTGVLVARIAERAGWPLDYESALALYVSLYSDTGSFRFSNTNAEALQLAASLVGDHEVAPWLIAERLSERIPMRRYRLLSKVLGDIELLFDGQVALMIVTHEMLKETKAAWEDTDGLANYARALAGVDCGVLLTPAKTGGIRISLRSKGQKIDAGQVCHELGGGGHRGAAGCVVPGDLAAARETLDGALAKALAKADAV